MSKFSGNISVKIGEELVHFKFGTGAWKILFEEHKYSSILHLTSTPEVVWVPHVLHAGACCYARLNDKPDPKIELVCEWVDEMEDKDAEKVLTAWTKSNYMGTSIDEMKKKADKTLKTETLSEDGIEQPQES